MIFDDQQGYWIVIAHNPRIRRWVMFLWNETTRRIVKRIDRFYVCGVITVQYCTRSNTSDNLYLDEVFRCLEITLDEINKEYEIPIEVIRYRWTYRRHVINAVLDMRKRFEQFAEKIENNVERCINNCFPASAYIKDYEFEHCVEYTLDSYATAKEPENIDECGWDGRYGRCNPITCRLEDWTYFSPLDVCPWVKEICCEEIEW